VTPRKPLPIQPGEKRRGNPLGSPPPVAPVPTSTAAPADAPPDVARLWVALKDVRDPELPISLVDLGLIYDIRRAGARVEIDMTFTATACPCMGFIKFDIEERLLQEEDVDDVIIHVVWDPPWTRARMTEEGRAILRQFGVAA
jgi:metal-sulfur cluster biosynthetic enzyme